MTDEYFELDLPVAPAVMVQEEIVTEGADSAQEDLEAAIFRKLELEEPVVAEKGLFQRLFKW